jgi:hypothetical protein
MNVLRSIRSRVGSLFGRAPLFNEETRVARYLVLPESAGGFSVPHSGGISDRHFRDIKAPGVIPQISPVIFFRTMNTGTPSFSVRLNESPLIRQSFTSAEPSSWHEIIPAGSLRAEGNELTFAVNGQGSVTFSEVVILYTSSETTVKTPPVLSPD